MPVFRSLSVLLLCAAAVSAADLKTLSGKTVSGDLVSINEKDGIAIRPKDAKDPVATPLVNALQLDLVKDIPAIKLPPCTRVELTDGSVLYCKPDDGFRIVNKNQVELILLSGTKVVTPLKTLYTVLKNGQDAKFRDSPDWKTCIDRSQGIIKGVKKATPSDVRVKRDGDTVNGFRVSFLENGEGTTLRYVREGYEDEDKQNPRKLDLLEKDILGVIFTKSVNQTFVPSVCKVDDLELNRFVAAKVELKEGGNLVVTTVTGAKVEYPLKQVGRLDFSKGKVEFISDLPKDGIDVEVKVEKKPDGSDRTFQICYNKNFKDEKLQLRHTKEGKEIVEQYDHGLFLPATSQLLYKLGGEYDEFTAVLGVDEAASNPETKARVTIEGDGAVLLSAEVTPTAVLIKGKDPKEAKRAERFTINIRDVKELRIKVEPMNIVYGGHVDLADAKISKASK
jgi:hypothetical protein